MYDRWNKLHAYYVSGVNYSRKEDIKKKATESLSRVKFSDLHNDIIHCIRHIQVFYHKINQNNIDFIPDMRILHMSDEIIKLFES